MAEWFESLLYYLYQVIACRTGRMAAERLPGAAVIVMMAESVIPIGAKFVVDA